MGVTVVVVLGSNDEERERDGNILGALVVCTLVVILR